MICEFWGADPQRIDSVDITERALRDAVRAGKATLVDIFVHRFSPFGISGIAVIAESHLAVHTWPEMGYCAADFFTCGDSVDMPAIVETLREAYAAERVEVRTLPRGVQSTCADTAAYYETLVHPALHCHPDPRRVAIVGGRDLRSLTEALRHPLDRIDLLGVTEHEARIAEKHTPEVRGAIDDARVRVHGVSHEWPASVRDCDVVIVDPVDRVAATTPAAFAQLMAHVERVSSQDAIVVLPLGTVSDANHLARRHVAELSARYEHVALAWSGDATTPGALSAIALASATVDVMAPQRASVEPTVWYDADHHAWHFLSPKARALFG